MDDSTKDEKQIPTISFLNICGLVTIQAPCARMNYYSQFFTPSLHHGIFQSTTMDRVPTHHMDVDLGYVTCFANRMLADVTQVETKNVIAWFLLALVLL